MTDRSDLETEPTEGARPAEEASPREVAPGGDAAGPGADGEKPAPDEGPGADEAPGADADEIVELAPEEAERLLAGYRASRAEPEDRGKWSDDEIELPAGFEPPEIPGYRIEGVIGRGATGIVFRARQEAVDRSIALKVLHSEHTTNERSVRRLKREARLAAKLAHPSIISAIDMGEVDGRWWYAMELVEGVSLSRRIAERGSLTERECLRLFSPLCDALQHAHEVGVVHRDIKPANILLDGRGRARLVDLGLAVGQNDPSITRTGSTLGTPHYVSPEQARDPADADIRSDLWSIGATMYHAVCGRPPFTTGHDEGVGVAEILSRVLYMPVVDPREEAPGLSKGFALLLGKCLTRDADQRYQEPWELVADIETLRERRRLDLRGSQVDPFASRRPRWMTAAIAGVGVVVLVLSTWLLTAQPWRERPGDGGGGAGPSLADWPALRDLQEAFDGGAVLHSGALAELDAVAPGLPEEARYFENELRTRIKQDLRAEVDAAIRRVEARVTAALEERDFDRARAIASGALAGELRDATGYAGAGTLPAGQPRTEATAYVEGARDRVERAHARALDEARGDLRAAMDDALLPEIERLASEGRYRTALARLAPEAGPSAWIERAGDRVDVRGLEPHEIARIADSIEVAVGETRERVNGAAFAAYTSAIQDLEAVEGELLDDIDAGLVTGEESLVDVLLRRMSERNARASRDPAELPAEYADYYASQLDISQDTVRRREEQARAELARRDLARLEREAAQAIEARDYAPARKLFERASEDGWRGATRFELETRMRELDLMLEARDAIVRAIDLLDGTEVRLTFDGIGVVGEVDADGDEAGERGFRFTGPPGAPSGDVLVWRPVDEPMGAGARELAGADLPDLLRAEGVEMTRTERLGLAAILAAEMELARALAELPASDPPPGDEAVVTSLEQRIQAAGGGLGRTGRRPEGGRPGSAAAEPPSIDEVYGTPNQVESGLDVRLAWNFDFGGVDVPEGERGFAQLEPLPTGASRLGAWSSGGWREDPYAGLVLDDPLPNPAGFFNIAGGPYLILEEGLDRRRGVRARLWLRPDRPEARDHIVRVSLGGYDVVLSRGRAWFGSGDLRDLYRHIQSGEVSSTDDYESRPAPRLRAGELQMLEIAVRGSSLDALEFDGKDLGFPRDRRAPERRDTALRLRSMEPIALVAAEVEAKRPRR